MARGQRLRQQVHLLPILILNPLTHVNNDINISGTIKRVVRL